MWPLLALSLVSITFSLERAMFWLVTNRPGRTRWLDTAASLLRTGDLSALRALAGRDNSVYGRALSDLASRCPITPDEADTRAVEIIEAHRKPIERFGATLSTIITAAPMLGILGTVMGIIASFRLLGADDAIVTDPTAVAAGIAEALLTTAFGLIIAMITLFPYAWFRVSADRCFGRLESLTAAATQTKTALQRPAESIPSAHKNPAA